MIKSTLNINLDELEIPPQYPIDTAQMQQYELNEKVSFLLKGNIDSSATLFLLDGRKTHFGVEFKLNPPVGINVAGEHRFPHGITEAVLARHSAVSTEKSEGIDTIYGEGSLRFHLSPDNRPVARPTLVIGQLSIRSAIEKGVRNALSGMRHLTDFLCRFCDSRKDWSAARICSFFGMIPHPRGEKVTAPLYRPIPFPPFKTPSSMKHRTFTQDEAHLKTLVCSIDKTANLPDNSLIFDFVDEHSNPTFKVVALYNHETRSKLLLPFSAFIQNGSNEAEMFGFLPTKTISWSTPESEFEKQAIVICPNIEFVFWNRKRFLKMGKLLITFPEPYGRYDLLDLKALNSAAKVTLLVANFEGETMAQSCADSLHFAEVLNEALDDKTKFSILTWTIAFHPVPDTQRTTQELADFVNREKPQITESVLFNSFDEFKAVCISFEQKHQHLLEAASALNTLWEERPLIDNTSETSESHINERAKTKWLIRSLVQQDGYIELVAHEKIGKTNFAITLAYEIVTANQKSGLVGLIPGRFLTVAKSAAPKISYLDAELGKEAFDVKRDSVKKTYLPHKSKEAVERDANFRYHDLRADGIPYAKRENHQHILDLLAEDVESGTPGPIGLVILDTRRGFTRNQVGLEAQLAELIKNIRDNFHCAVLVCHHMTPGTKDPAGNYSVTTEKTGMIKMYRDYVSSDSCCSQCDLASPVKFEFWAYTTYQPFVDRMPFYAKCEEGRWTLMEMDGEADGMNTKFKPVKYDEKEQLKALCADYKKYAKLTKADVAEYLGTTDDTLSARIK